MVAHKTRESDVGWAENQDDLITNQYAVKEHLKPIYGKLMLEIRALGKDVEIAPKIVDVNIRRKKQFVMLTPASKSRHEIGINPKGQEAGGILAANNSTSAMCSHHITLIELSDINNEVIDCIQMDYDKAE